MPVLPKR